MQKRSSFRGTVAALVLFLTSVGTAQAATLYAGPVKLDGYMYTTCLLHNVGKSVLKDMSIHATVQNHGTRTYSGNMLPGTILDISRYNNGQFRNIGSCKFEFKGSSRNVRAMLCIEGLYEDACLSAVPAQ